MTQSEIKKRQLLSDIKDNKDIQELEGLCLDSFGTLRAADRIEVLQAALVHLREGYNMTENAIIFQKWLVGRIEAAELILSKDS